MTLEELKPCPFCTGNTPEIYKYDDGRIGKYIVQCTSCEYESEGYATKKDAVKWYNYRPAEDALKAEVARWNSIETERGDLLYRTLGHRDLVNFIARFKELTDDLATMTAERDALKAKNVSTKGELINRGLEIERLREALKDLAIRDNYEIINVHGVVKDKCLLGIYYTKTGDQSSFVHPADIALKALEHKP